MTDLAAWTEEAWANVKLMVPLALTQLLITFHMVKAALGIPEEQEPKILELSNRLFAPDDEELGAGPTDVADFAQRQTDPADPRRYRISLTAAGREPAAPRARGLLGSAELQAVPSDPLPGVGGVHARLCVQGSGLLRHELRRAAAHRRRG